MKRSFLPPAPARLVPRLTVVLVFLAAVWALVGGSPSTALAVTRPAPAPTLLAGNPGCAEVFAQFFPGATSVIEIAIGDTGGSLTFSGSAGGATVVGTLNANRNTIETFTLTAPAGQQIDDALVVVGALHLLGDDGVVEKLRARGYQVERICSACKAGTR